MLITLHDIITGRKVGVDIRNISFFAENSGVFEGKEYTGTAIFISGQKPFVVKESYDQVRELIELTAKKRGKT